MSDIKVSMYTEFIKNTVDDECAKFIWEYKFENTSNHNITLTGTKTKMIHRITLSSLWHDRYNLKYIQPFKTSEINSTFYDANYDFDESKTTYEKANYQQVKSKEVFVQKGERIMPFNVLLKGIIYWDDNGKKHKVPKKYIKMNNREMNKAYKEAQGN